MVPRGAGATICMCESWDALDSKTFVSPAWMLQQCILAGGVLVSEGL